MDMCSPAPGATELFEIAREILRSPSEQCATGAVTTVGVALTSGVELCVGSAVTLDVGSAAGVVTVVSGVCDDAEGL